MRYADVWPRYAKFWDTAVINAARVSDFTKEAAIALTRKPTYLEIQMATGLPWPMIATIHRRESGANFATYLGNGQPLVKRTTITPVGRGPFNGPSAFFNGAVDAIGQEGWGNVSDWRLEKILYYAMLFNGAGYEMRGLPSPYIWGGTSIQRPGKFVADHDFNPHVMDDQPGCAPLLFMIARLDTTVKFIRETAT
jgi:lysozyme family protein